MDRFETAKNLIAEAGERLKKAVLGEGDIHLKNGHQDLVTLCDRQTEEFLRKNITEFFPKDSIVGEEFPDKNGSEYIWYIDPIDGTSNFVSQKKNYAISIACYYRDTPFFSLVLDVSQNALFSAVSGGGAYKNGVRLHTSETRKLEQMLFTTPDVLSAFIVPHTGADALIRLAQDVRCVRCMGSVALEMCQVACGEADIFAAVHSSPWDHNGARLILTEAGGAVLSLEGNKLPSDRPSTELACSSEYVIQYIVNRYIKKT